MPERLARRLFIAGFCTYLLGLILVVTIGSSNKTETGVDYIHWSMLGGVALMLPFATSLRQGAMALIASLLLTTGIICVIGMCVLDLAFWGIGDDDLRQAVAMELTATPSVWSPFMLYGSEEVFYVGLIAASLCYWRATKIGTVLVLAGAILAIAGPAFFNIAGAASALSGFLFNFRATDPGLLAEGSGAQAL